MNEAVRRLFGASVELVLPRRCAACGAGDPHARPFCSPCGLAMLGLLADAYCMRCGSSLPEGFAPEPEGCPNCPTPMPRFERFTRLGRHEGPLAQGVRGLKFAGLHRVGIWMGDQLAQRLEAEGAMAGIDLIQPVPLHWLRRLRRGYNQAEMIARGLAGRAGLPMGALLRRVRDTPPQVGLSRSRRLINVRGAFAVAGASRLRGRHVLLVDDVATTGATADEAARALLRAGAAHVSLAVLAKADPAGRNRLQ